jgi:hypothetical protein
MGSTADHQHPDRCDVCNKPEGNCDCSLLAYKKAYEERRVPPKQWEKPPVQNIPLFTNHEQSEKLNAIKPDYYRRTIKGVEIDVIDIIQAWGIGFLLGNALKYILRAGQKQGNSKDQDLGKAQENINREVLQGKEEIVGRCEHGVIQ